MPSTFQTAAVFVVALRPGALYVWAFERQAGRYGIGLNLAASVDVDPKTGEFVLDDGGRPRLGPGGLLIRWEEVEYLEFIDS